MSLPTTARGTPSGIMLKDGFPAKIAFETNPTISFKEKSVKPPKMSGGNPIETSTMHNTTVKTKTASSLIDFGEASVKASYDPNLVNQILALINVEQGVTFHYPDGSTLDFYGYLMDFDPDAFEEGKQPECSLTIVSTNADPTTGAEVLPVLTSAVGT